MRQQVGDVDFKWIQSQTAMTKKVVMMDSDRKENKTFIIGFYDLELKWAELNSESYPKEQRSWLDRRARATELRKRGLKVNLDFQREVWNQIILAVYEYNNESTGTTSLKILANVAYTYSIIRFGKQH
eukprot:gene32542-43473_t